MHKTKMEKSQPTKEKQSYKSLFPSIPGRCFVLRGFCHHFLWVTVFSQSLISGPFEKQIESSTNVRKPTASYSPMSKTDALQMTQVKINATNQADAEMPEHSASPAESFSLTREGEHKNSASLLTSSFFFLLCCDKA